LTQLDKLLKKETSKTPQKPYYHRNNYQEGLIAKPVAPKRGEQLISERAGDLIFGRRFH
jgi:hypothetical protein